ncbi:hypothetical protein Taro_053513 [Colocasia esculenta]|uniref:Uncharacterized protein n=1 Tax=Colocasia esculenta TaxID=4460 RepID=A0A843XMU3_COLES|nr:hypothetical protein [Colocasia esculenta]
MSASQHSESLNHFFDGFVTMKTLLFEFVLKLHPNSRNKWLPCIQSPFVINSNRISEDESSLTLRVKTFECVKLKGISTDMKQYTL